MAKISPVSIKYMIYASFRAAGPVEKPDVIGAIFGQTEGLLGSDMEMRELQKEGKIGRIEVELETIDGKSIGEIRVPTAIDKSATTLIAAALETIDRIGPTEARIEITKIEDVRGSKRDFILARAKRLMDSIEDTGSFREMSESLKVESRSERIQEYGMSKLPAGDLSGDEIVVVEGRADVVNLLRNRINNVVGMDGTKMPPEIVELSKTKEITLFVDGDRGGILIANNIINNARVAYIAIAPEGREVEELTGKEILIALRRRIPASEFFSRSRREIKEIKEFSSEPAKETVEKEIKIELKDAKEKLREVYEQNKGAKGAFLLDSSLDIIRKTSIREVAKSLHSSKKEVFAIILEGTANLSIIKACEEKGVAYLAATNFSGVDRTNVNLVSL